MCTVLSRMHAAFFYVSESSGRDKAYNESGERVQLCPVWHFLPSLHESGAEGKYFLSGGEAAQTVQMRIPGRAEKKQECEFPCRSDAVIFFMPI